MAANAYFLASNFSDAAGSMATLADIVHVRTSAGDFVTIKEYWQHNTTRAVVFADPNDVVNYTHYPIESDINAAGTFPFSDTTIGDMRRIEGQIQSAYNDRNVELRECTATVTFPAV